jgi:hypothetical protein
VETSLAARAVGWNISDPPLTRWVCGNGSQKAGSAVG